MIGYLLRLRFGAAVWRQVRNCKPDPLVLAGEADDVRDWFAEGRIAASVLCRWTAGAEAYSLIGTPSGDLTWLPNATMATTEVADVNEVVEFATAIGSRTQVNWQPVQLREDGEWVHVESLDDWVYFRRWDGAGRRGVGPLCSASANDVLAKIPVELQFDVLQSELPAAASPLELSPDDREFEERLLARFMHSGGGEDWAIHPILAADSLSLIRGLTNGDATNEPPETDVAASGRPPAVGAAAAWQSPDGVVAADKQTSSSGFVSDRQSPEQGAAVALDRQSPEQGAAVALGRPARATGVAASGEAVEVQTLARGIVTGGPPVPNAMQPVGSESPPEATGRGSPGAFDRGATRPPSESGAVAQDQAPASVLITGDMRRPSEVLRGGPSDRVPHRESSRVGEPSQEPVLGAAAVHAYSVASISELPQAVQPAAVMRETPQGQESRHHEVQSPFPRTVTNGEPRTSGINVGISARLPQELAATPKVPLSAHQPGTASRPGTLHEPDAQREHAHAEGRAQPAGMRGEHGRGELTPGERARAEGRAQPAGMRGEHGRGGLTPGERARAIGPVQPAGMRGQPSEITHAVVDGETSGPPMRLSLETHRLPELGRPPDRTVTRAQWGETPMELPNRGTQNRLGAPTSPGRGESLVTPTSGKDGPTSVMGRDPLSDVRSNYPAELAHDRNDLQPQALPRQPSLALSTASPPPFRRFMPGAAQHTPATRRDTTPSEATTTEVSEGRDRMLSSVAPLPIARILANAEHRTAGPIRTTTDISGHLPLALLASTVSGFEPASLKRRSLAQKSPTTRATRASAFTVSRGTEIGEVTVEIGLDDSLDSRDVPAAAGSLIAAIPQGRMGGRR